MLITVIVLFLLFLTAFFVAAEFSTVAVKNVTVESMAERGMFLAKRLLPFVKDANALDSYVSTCQIVTTVCSLIIGALAERFITPAMEPLVVRFLGETPLGLVDTVWKPVLSIVVVVAMTVIQLIVAEILPKAIAVRYTERVAMIAIMPVTWCLKTFGWLIHIFNGSSAFILRSLGVKLDSERHAHSPEELSSLVEHTGGIAESAREVLERVLRFDARCVRDVMVPRNLVQGIDAEMSREEILDLVVKSTHTRFPVYQGSEDNILGIIHLKDLLQGDIKSRHKKTSCLESLRTKARPALYCPSSLGVDRVLEKMRESRVYMAILVDEFGGYDGIVTIEDIIEEVLGEIHDEFDVDGQKTEEFFKELSPGEYLVSGPMLLDNLREDEQISLTVNGNSIARVHTVAGLVMHLHGGVPEAGTVVSCDGYTLRVTKMEGRQVVTVCLRAKKGEEVGK